MSSSSASERRRIVSIPVHATSYRHALSWIERWAMRRESRSVFAVNVNSVMEAYDRPEFRSITESADLVTPDGMPLVWCLRRLGVGDASRVYGPDLTVEALTLACRLDLPVGFYGSEQRTLERLLAVIQRRWPALRVVYAFSPPFRELSRTEDAEVCRAIRDSAPQLLFVGLGCPRQEEWIAAHRGILPCVMLGVGAAFDFISGAKPQAPRWMMRFGLEWAFRLATEPRRLARRYLLNNPRFIGLFLLQLLRQRFGRRAARKNSPLSAAGVPRQVRRALTHD